MRTDKEKELDELFARGLDNPAENNTFLNEDWEAMEAMLDAGKRRRGIVYLLPILGGVAAVLLLVFGWFFFAKVEPQNVATVNPVKKNTIDNTYTSKNNNAQQSPKLNTQAQPISVTQQSLQAVTKPRGNANKAVAPIYQQTTPFNIIKPLPVVTEVNQPAAVYANTPKPSPAQKSIVTPAVDTTAIAAIQLKPADNTTNAANNLAAYQSQQNAIIAAAKGDTSTKAAGQKTTNIAKITQKNSGGFRPTFAVAVVASPDLNGVGSSFTETKVGVNAGAIFSFGVSRKFTISTGAVYSKKPYITDFSNYHTSFAFKNTPAYVTADCRVLDIPLNVDYQVYGKGANKISVGTGLSSYFMLRENYTYDYNATGVAASEYDIANKNHHLFGVLNLSATYQRQLNPRLGLNIQPYYKLPLTQIGYGKVNLQSSGVALGFSWALSARK